ncbi:DUF3309 family protein [Nocardia gipuzkoensis]
MKRLLFLVLAIITAASTYDYSRSAGHYGLIAAGGVIAVLLLAGKLIE